MGFSSRCFNFPENKLTDRFIWEPGKFERLTSLKPLSTMWKHTAVSIAKSMPTHSHSCSIIAMILKLELK